MSAAALAIDYVNKKTNHKFHIPIKVLKVPETDKEYARLQKILNKLIDEVRDNEHHPLVDLMEIIGNHLEIYDDQHYPAIGSNISNIEMVRYLMESKRLVQKDLAPIFGSQGNVSLFLKGERSLNRNHIAKLKETFGLSADLFI